MANQRAGRTILIVGTFQTQKWQQVILFAQKLKSIVRVDALHSNGIATSSSDDYSRRTRTVETGSTVGDWNSGKVYTGALVLDYWATWNWIGCVLWELGFGSTPEAIVLQFQFGTNGILGKRIPIRKQRFELRRRCKHIHQVKQKDRVIGRVPPKQSNPSKKASIIDIVGLILQELVIDSTGLSS